MEPGWESSLESVAEGCLWLPTLRGQRLLSRVHSCAMGYTTAEPGNCTGHSWGAGPLSRSACQEGSSAHPSTQYRGQGTNRAFVPGVSCPCPSLALPPWQRHLPSLSLSFLLHETVLPGSASQCPGEPPFTSDKGSRWGGYNQRLREGQPASSTLARGCQFAPTAQPQVQGWARAGGPCCNGL